MMLRMAVRNRSHYKSMYRTDNLLRLAERVCAGEGFQDDAELGLLFCDDAFIAALNRTYRKKNCPTDVLAFGYEPAARPRPETQNPKPHSSVLGDLVISLETVVQRCADDHAAMRAEVRLLFCHGLLHLLGWHHDTVSERGQMAAKQAHYLDVDEDAAWHKR
jgi:rRNA maturation RNase YbeY